MLWMERKWPLFRWLSIGLFWAARPGVLWLRIGDAVALSRSRRELAALDDRLCDDIGVAPHVARREAERPVRDELSPWASAELRKTVAQAQARHGALGSQNERSSYHSRGRGDGSPRRCSGRSDTLEADQMPVLRGW